MQVLHKIRIEVRHLCTIVVTGTLKNFSRGDIKKKIEDLEGKVTDSVSKRLRSSSPAKKQAASSTKQRNSASRLSMKPSI